jgi:formate hydrogenlyase subunit 3/multisubunit Na+/H+ antiporter MnhD subunit
MVNPLYLIAVFLIGAFLVPFVDRADRRLSLGVMYFSLLYTASLSLMRLWQLFFTNGNETQVFTAGFQPPLSIALSFGFREALLTALVNLTGFLSGVYLLKNSSNQEFSPYRFFCF